MSKILLDYYKKLSFSILITTPKNTRNSKIWSQIITYYAWTI